MNEYIKKMSKERNMTVEEYCEAYKMKLKLEEEQKTDEQKEYERMKSEYNRLRFGE